MARDCTASPETRLRSLEQLIGGASVGLGFGKMLLDPGNLLPEQLDPLAKLGHRQRPEVLFADQGQWLDRFAGKEVVLVHALQR